MDDTSLDDFLADGEAADESTSEEREPDIEESDSESEGETEQGDDTKTAVDPVDPATTTSQWDGGGVVCPVCEEAVHRVWESADGLVCVTCKEW